MNRPALIKMIHIGRSRLGWDDNAYRTWMQEEVGKSSSTDCTDQELSKLVTYLQEHGALEQKAETVPASAGRRGRPTEKQWEYALDLSKKLGMDGTMDDPSLVTLCRRVAKADHPRFLNQKGIGSLINALQGWLESRRKQEERPS
jgi:phage gp16-like protein